MGYVDAHVHVWTDDFEHYPLAEGYTPRAMIPPTFAPEDILRHAEPSGVDRVVLVQMSYYGTDNSYMLDTIRRYPGVFGGIAVIDEGRPDVEEEMNRLAEQGVRGFRIQPRQSPAGDWLETEGYHRMFAEAAKRHLMLCCLMGPDGIDSVAAMCGQYHHAPVVIDHLCRIGMDGSIRDSDVDALCRLCIFENLKVKISAFYALGQKQPPHDELLPMIQRVCDAFDPRALMWGSDCPYQVQEETYEDGLALVRDRVSFKSADAREWILGKTAESYFFA